MRTDWAPAPKLRGRGDGVVTAIAFVVAALVGVAGCAVVLLAEFSFDACGNGGCWYPGGTIVLIGYPVLALVLVGGALTLAIRRRMRNRPGWPPVVIAVPAVLLAIVIGVVVITVSATPR